MKARTANQLIAELRLLERFDAKRSRLGHDYGNGQRNRELIRRQRELEARIDEVLGDDGRELEVDELRAAFERVARPRLRRLEREDYRSRCAATRLTVAAWRGIEAELELLSVGDSGGGHLVPAWGVSARALDDRRRELRRERTELELEAERLGLDLSKLQADAEREGLDLWHVVGKLAIEHDRGVIGVDGKTDDERDAENRATMEARQTAQEDERRVRRDSLEAHLRETSGYRHRTLEELVKEEGELELVEPPVCPYCNVRVGDDEWDGESGGYFSAHHRCYSPTVDGIYAATVLRGGEVETRTRYRTMLAARSTVERYASSNYPRSEVVYVVQMNAQTPDGSDAWVPLYSTRGTLLAPRERMALDLERAGRPERRSSGTGSPRTFLRQLWELELAALALLEARLKAAPCRIAGKHDSTTYGFCARCGAYPEEEEGPQ